MIAFTVLCRVVAELGNLIYFLKETLHPNVKLLLKTLFKCLGEDSLLMRRKVIGSVREQGDYKKVEYLGMFQLEETTEPFCF